MAPDGAFDGQHWLRSFSYGHRQIEAALGVLIGRPWDFRAGPGDGRLMIDATSTVSPRVAVYKNS